MSIGFPISLCFLFGLLFRTFAGSVAPVPISNDWKNNQFIANANGYIHVCHFSDTFLIYTHYLFKRPSWWLSDSFYEPYPLLIGEINTDYCPLFFRNMPSIYLFYKYAWNSFVRQLKQVFLSVDASRPAWPL